MPTENKRSYYITSDKYCGIDWVLSLHLTCWFWVCARSNIFITPTRLWRAMLMASRNIRNIWWRTGIETEDRLQTEVMTLRQINYRQQLPVSWQSPSHEWIYRAWQKSSYCQTIRRCQLKFISKIHKTEAQQSAAWRENIHRIFRNRSKHSELYDWLSLGNCMLSSKQTRINDVFDWLQQSTKAFTALRHLQNCFRSGKIQKSRRTIRVRAECVKHTALEANVINSATNFKPSHRTTTASVIYYFFWNIRQLRNRFWIEPSVRLSSSGVSHLQCRRLTASTDATSVLSPITWKPIEQVSFRFFLPRYYFDKCPSSLPAPRRSSRMPPRPSSFYTVS